MPRTTPLLPISVRRTVAALGHDIRRARQRRRLTAAIVAARSQISRPTLLRVERGDPSVSLGIYATVLWVLGLSDRLGSIAASESDLVGLGLEDERLPKRVSSGRKRARRDAREPGATVGDATSRPSAPESR